MNLKALALAAALSASPLAANNLEAQTIYRPIADNRAEAPRTTNAPLALDKALSEAPADSARSRIPSIFENSFVRSGNLYHLVTNTTAQGNYRATHGPHREIHLPHPEHPRHLPLSFYQFRPSQAGKNIPVHEYEALIHTPPLGKRGLLHHIEAEFGVMIATEPHAHYSHGHRTYSLATQPGIVIGFKIH